MEDLNRRTADELIRVHNARCAGADRIEGPWKGPKRDLIGRIRALDEPEATEDRTAAAESAGADGARTVGAMVEALVATDLAYDEIVRLVRERFPDARTTARSVASVASVLRRRGVAVPLRRRVRAQGQASSPSTRS